MNKIQGPRAIAIETLYRWQGTSMAVDHILKQLLREVAPDDRRDRNLAFSLVYGAIRWRAYLDWIIAQYSSHPLPEMDSQVLQALRVGLYQLLFMDRIPPSAALNETVQALKNGGQPKWKTGFANGVLRNISRNLDKIPKPQPGGTAMADHIALSHPQWLFDRWQKRYGLEQTRRICQQNNTEPPLVLRVNSRQTTPAALIDKLARNKIAAIPGRYAPEALYITEKGGEQVTELPGFAEGAFQVQDEAAQLVSHLLGPLQPAVTYLDGCAGLGGKTSHLAQMLPAEARIIAIEPNFVRVTQLRENLDRLGLGARVAIRHESLKDFRLKDAGTIAGILIDAPCSGLGVIRRHPDIRWNRNVSDLRRYQEEQLSLLETAAPLLTAGGVLLYATCSTEPEENDEVVRLFLANHPQISRSHAGDFLPSTAANLIDEQGQLRTLPGDHGLDGFFAARMVKC